MLSTKQESLTPLHPVEQWNEKRILVLWIRTRWWPILQRDEGRVIPTTYQIADTWAFHCSRMWGRCISTEGSVWEWKSLKWTTRYNQTDQVEGFRFVSCRLNGEENHDNEVSSIVERVEKARNLEMQRRNKTYPKPDNGENNTDEEVAEWVWL